MHAPLFRSGYPPSITYPWQAKIVLIRRIDNQSSENTASTRGVSAGGEVIAAFDLSPAEAGVICIMLIVGSFHIPSETVRPHHKSLQFNIS